jgi:hypothetical protein
MVTFVECTESRETIHINLALVTYMRRTSANTETKITFASGLQITVRETPKDLIEASKPEGH